MPASSIGKIGSLRRQKARIDIQNGLVYQKTMIRDMGASGAAMLNSTKFVWPDSNLTV